MPLVYSPIDGSELDPEVEVRPRTAFLMLHANDRVSAVEARMQGIVRQEIEKQNFEVVTATDIARSHDYLVKIIRMIQGCGFGVAVFSDVTPAKTLANIFFEVGYCLALGKPTQIVLTGDAAAPSDFIRSEWIEFTGDETKFRASLQSFVSDMRSYGDFLHTLAETAEQAEEIDPEIVYERYKRAFLLLGGSRELDGVRRIHLRLKGLMDSQAIGDVMRASRRRISDSMNGFIRHAGRTKPD